MTEIKKPLGNDTAILKEYRIDNIPIIIFDVERDGKVVETDRYVKAEVFELSEEELSILKGEIGEQAEDVDRIVS